MSDKYLPELTRGYDRLASTNNIFAYNAGVRETTTKANMFALESTGASWGVGTPSGLLQIFPSLDKTLENLSKEEGADAVKNSVGKLKGRKNTQELWATVYNQDPLNQTTTDINMRTLQGVKVGSSTLFRLA
jgi:hypothetical protein